MVRRYEEPIEVRERHAGVPEAFLWRSRLYVVREVLDHWQERRPWWRESLDPTAAASSVSQVTASPAVSPATASPAVSPATASPAAGDHSRGAGVVVSGARERRVWRVEASAGRSAGTGVYDLGADPGPGQWRLLRVAD